MDPYQSLANAVILSAAREYRLLMRKLYRKPNDGLLIRKLEDLEDFFHSDWFTVLTEANGTTLIRKLRASVDRYPWQHKPKEVTA